MVLGQYDRGSNNEDIQVKKISKVSSSMILLHQNRRFKLLHFTIPSFGVDLELFVYYIFHVFDRSLFKTTFNHIKIISFCEILFQFKITAFYFNII